jgi:hypothetical protein
MPKTSAVAMARSVGVDPDLFSAALRKKKFAWHAQGGGWLVEVDSPEHLQMIDVLKTVFAAQSGGPAARAATAPTSKATKKT